jgi:autotransporter-associated beta strand protein
MRQNWTDSKATFVGGMGGTYESHGHLQSGTFQLSARGVKWFIDLSSENYDVKNHNTTTPNSSGVDRWDYYRWRAEGHNCLVVNPTAGPDRIWNAPPAPLINYQSAQNGQRSFAVWDLSDNISGVTRVQRGIQLLNNRRDVLVQDEIVLPSAGTAWWYAHFQNTSTAPAISGDGSSVILTSGTERLWGKIVSGSGVWTVRPASALIQTHSTPVADTPNTGKSKLAIQLTGVTNTTLAVWFVPLAPGENPPTTTPAITPLSSWNLTTQNEAPVTSNGFATIVGGAPLDLNLGQFAADDWTPPTRLTFAVSNPVGGTVSLLPDGFTARFTPTPGFNGTQSFTFTATDDDGDTSAPATITISATPVVSTWSNTAGGNWSTAGNWQENIAPVSGRGADLRFFNGQSVPAATINISNDIAGTFDANQLHFSGTGTATTVVNLSGNPLRLVRNGTSMPAITLSGITTGYRYNIANGITLADDVTINASNSGTFVFNGAISGSGGITRTGTPSTLILAGNNSYAGPTTISGGTLQIGNDGATGTLGSGPVSIASGATLRFDRTGTLDVPNDISGAGALLVHGPTMNDVVQLTGDNSFTGSVTVNSGSLRITDAVQLGAGTKAIFATSSTAALRLDGSNGPVELPAEFTFSTSNPNGAIINDAGNNSIGGSLTLTSGAGSTRLTSLGGTLTIEGNVAPNVTGRSLELRGAGNGSINGAILDGSTTNVLTGLSKNDGGTWTLNGKNTFTGGTTVSAGRLVINGTHNSGAVTVASGATLAGRGNLSAATTVNGTLAPGDTFGAMTLANTVSFGATSRVQWELGANTLAAADAVNAGAVTVTAGAKIDVVLNSPGSAVNVLHSFWRSARVIPIVSGSALTGAFSFGTITPDAGGRAVATYGSFTLQHTATAVNLVWTPIPGFPVIDDPVLTITRPAVSPVSLLDETHALHVSAVASGGSISGYAWTLVSGPGSASFVNPSAADTLVTFDEPGNYVLRCTALNQVGSAARDVTVEVAPTPSTVVLQEGVNGAACPATFIRNDTTTWNSGARNQIIVGRNGSTIFRALLGFTLPPALVGTVISDASLDLTIADVGQGTTIGTINLHRLLTSFVEGTGDGLSTTNGTGTGADWLRRTYTPSTTWSVSGTGSGSDYAASPLSTMADFDPTGTDAGTAFTFDSTAGFVAAVADAVNTAQPLYLLAKATGDHVTSGNFARFASDDHATTEWRPQLTVGYHDHLAPIINSGEAPAAHVGTSVTLTGTVTQGTGLGWTYVSGPGPVFFQNTTITSATLLFTKPGLHVLRLSASNAHGESSRTLGVEVTGVAWSELQIWRQTYFGNYQGLGNSADLSDANGDGEVNLLEYATDQSPHAATRAAISLVKNGATLAFTYTRSNAALADGVTFSVEWSDTLASDSWSSAGVSEQILGDNGTVETVKASVAGGTSRRFLHVKVAKP